MLVILGQKYKKLNDFADLSTDELVGGYDEIKGKRSIAGIFRIFTKQRSRSINNVCKRYSI